MRASIALTSLFLLAGCYDSHAVGAPDASRPDFGSDTSRPDLGRADTPADAAGLCCPLTSMGGCELDDVLPGGWAASRAECPGPTSFPRGPIYEVRDDERGCPTIRPIPSSGCLMPPPPPPCDLFSETECYGQDGCAPVYDDFCCPICGTDPFCADCVDYGFFECRTRERGCEEGVEPCAGVPAWGCDSAAPAECDGALVVAPTSCNRVGCVPAVGPVGSEDLPPSCRPVTADSCVALCSALPPECPEGTTAESDGGCWTGVCIPRRVCFG